jgi:ADP-ribosylglycohydrolase
MKRIHRETGYEDPEFRPMSEAAVSVPMAFIAFLEGNSYEEVLRIAISLGGDADTIGCMASSISVHLYGIPQEIYDEGCGFITSDMMAIIEEFDAKYLAK